MKKTSLLLIAIFVMTLCGCQSEPVQQLTTENETLKEVTTEKQEAKEQKEEIVYLDDENAGFVQGDIVRAPMSVEEADMLKSKNKYSEDLVAWNFSKYLIVEIAVVNQGTEKAMWFSSDVSEVIDSKGRKYNVLSEATSEIYLDDLITFVDLKPSIPVVWKVVYEVAKDSEGFYYETEDKTFKVMLQNRNENNE